MATRFSPTSTETSSSRLAAGSGGRRRGAPGRRLVAPALLPLRELAPLRLLGFVLLLALRRCRARGGAGLLAPAATATAAASLRLGGIGRFGRVGGRCQFGFGPRRVLGRAVGLLVVGR